MDKMELLQKILNEEGAYAELVESLDKFARDKDSYEYGLPTHEIRTMKLMIKEWLAKLIVAA